MTRASQGVPETVKEYTDEARRYVQQALGFALDGTPDTLSALDHYLSGVAGEAPEIMDLVAVAAGCYFGELVRARYDGEWKNLEADPLAWRLLIPTVGLSFSPVAVAYQAIIRVADDHHDDSLQVPDNVRSALVEALDRLPMMPEDVYYGLTNRWDTLETIMDVLVSVARSLREKEASPKKGQNML